MNWTRRWEAAEALWTIESAIVMDLPGLAVEAMQGGWDAPSLRLLAGMSSREDARDVRDMFLEADRELGRELPGRREAARRLVRLYSSDILAGRVTPRAGARLITELGYGQSDSAPGVEAFVGLEDEYGGPWGRRREEVDADVIAAAQGAADAE